jgi:hypothetical protein
VFDGSIWIHSPDPTIENSPMSATAVTRGNEQEDFVPSLYYNGMVIRARAFDGSGRGSETVTQSFFVDRHGVSRFDGIQVMSVTVEPLYFADPVYGLYRNWTRHGPDDEGVRNIVHVEMFAPGGALMFAQDVQAWVMGQSSRSRPNKSLRFNFNQGGGDITGMPDFIPDTFRNYYDPTTPVENFRHMNVRNGDPYLTGFRDSLVHLISEPLRPTIQNAAYGAVFINGEFWSTYCFRTHRNAYLLGEMFGLDRDLIVTNRDWQDRTNAQEIYDLLQTYGYEGFQRYVCLDDLIDYLIINYHFSNGDGIRNNFEFWRVTEEVPGVHGGDGRWRFILQDFDIAIGRIFEPMDLSHHVNWLALMTTYFAPGQWFNSGNMKINFLNTLFAEEHFRNTFAARYATYAATVFNPDRAGAIFDAIIAERTPTIGSAFYRWYRTGIEHWHDSIPVVGDFMRYRTDYSIMHIREHYNSDRPGLGLDLPAGYGEIRWTVDPGEGFFDIAGAQIRADLFERQGQIGFSVGDFTARYIPGLPVDVTLKPFDGFTFTSFTVTGASNYNQNGYTLTVIPAAGVNISVKAILEPDALIDFDAPENEYISNENLSIEEPDYDSVLPTNEYNSAKNTALIISVVFIGFLLGYVWYRKKRSAYIDNDT